MGSLHAMADFDLYYRPVPFRARRRDLMSR
jgi:hypothetical protein